VRPIVGVTGPDRGGTTAWLFSSLAILRAGGIPRRITPSRPCSIDRVDALVLGGGADVDPRLYGQCPQTVRQAVGEARARYRRRRSRRASAMFLAPLVFATRRLFEAGTSDHPDIARDALERELLDDALARGVPVLGICRGAQLINVALGGSLHPTLEGFYDETPQMRTIFPRKPILVAPRSILASIVQRREIRVNALHDQAVESIGRGLAVVAREPNGVVQAIEHRHLPFVLGVQWHPEYVPQHRRQRAIFERLVKEARAKRMETAAHAPTTRTA